MLSALIVLAALWIPAALADAQGTGDIRGTVTEQAGGRLRGVTIVVTNTATRIERRTRSDANGLFAVPALPSGTYEVTATLDGFAAQRQERLHVGAGEAILSHLELRRALLQDTLSLASPPSAIDPLRTEVSTQIQRTEIDDLPLSDRNVLDLAALAPGVGLAASGIGLSAAGVAPFFNRRLVEGTDIAVGGHEREGAYPLSRESVENIQVHVGAPPAGSGRAGGMILDAALRSGSNRVTAGIFERYRGTGLRSTSPEHAALGRPRGTLQANQFGGTAGGPIAHDRHFFFFSYDGLREKDERAVFLNLPPGLTGNPPSDSALAQLSPLAARYTRTRDQNLLLAKTEHRVSWADRVSLRYLHQATTGVNSEPVGPFTSVAGSGPTDAGARSMALGAGSAFGDSIFNDVRVQYSYEYDRSGINSSLPQADIHALGALVLRAGGASHGPYDSTARRWQIADTATWTRGQHMLEGGFDIAFGRADEVFSAHRNGAYVFGSPAGFASGVPSAPGDSFTQAFLQDGRTTLTLHPDSDDYSFFVRDQWRPAAALTIDAGLRYDMQRAIETDANNWGPRLGAAWTPSDRYVVRAAYGVLYGRTPASLVSAIQAYDGVNVRLVTLRGDSGAAVPAYPDRLQAFPEGARTSLVTLAPGFQNPRVQHASGGIEWEWMPSTSVSTTYLHTSGSSLPIAVEANAGTPVPGTPGPLAGADRIISVESRGRSRYDGIVVEMRKRPSQGLQYRVSYTLSRASNTGPPVAAIVPGSPTDRFVGLHSDRHAPALDDQRHRFVGSVVFTSDNFADRFSGILETVLDDWRAGALYTLTGGSPFSAYVYGDLNGDGNWFNDLAPGTTRNGRRGKKEGRFDARLAREFALPSGLRLGASVDVFNVLNAAHYRDVDTTLYSTAGGVLVTNPLFGARSNAREPRVIQLGVSLAF